MLKTRITTLDRLLARHAAALGGDATAYRNHCYRVVNFALAFCSDTEDNLEKLAIVAAFHDLGIWTDATFDYLDPSANRAQDYLIETGQTEAAAEVDAMIRQHHKITRHSRASGDLVEAFRKADWIDVSLGVISFGMSGEHRRCVKAQFPNAGFHRRLLQLGSSRLMTHPLNPMPMMRW